MFAPGRTVLYRNLHPNGQFFSIRPCRVISDDERGLLLWLSQGTPVLGWESSDGRGVRDMPFTEWVTLSYRITQGRWAGPGVLKFFPPGADHSVWLFRDDAGTFTNWYVNLEDRALRWDDGSLGGVDVTDQDLDIVVAPDRSWQWKDEDEFTERLALPEHYWVHDESAVRAEAQRVIKQIEAGEFPFDGTWTDFRPDPSWPVPASVPSGWDRPKAQ
jgi:hypothetical protein